VLGHFRMLSAANAEVPPSYQILTLAIEFEMKSIVMMHYLGLEVWQRRDFPWAG
jgi:hypothetical protein